jgi:hypothetical protein
LRLAIRGLDFPSEHATGDVTLGNTVIKRVEKFKYLGRIVSADNKDAAALDARMAVANKTYFLLHRCYFKHAHVKTDLKVKIYNAIVRAQLLYAAETIAPHENDLRRIDAMHRKCLRQITGIQTFKNAEGEIRYPENWKVYKHANAMSLSNEIKVQKLRFYGHILRRPSKSDLLFLLDASVSPLLPLQHRGSGKYLVEGLRDGAAEAQLSVSDAVLRSRWKRKCKIFVKRLRELDQKPTDPGIAMRQGAIPAN